MGTEHVLHASKTVHAAVFDLCASYGFCGIASPMSKDALMSPVTSSVSQSGAYKVNKNQAEIIRALTCKEQCGGLPRASMTEPVLLTQLCGTTCSRLAVIRSLLPSYGMHLI